MKFVQILERVSKINVKLKAEGFTIRHINDFWINFISLIPIMQHRGFKNINVCINCGTLDIDPVCENHPCCDNEVLKNISQS